MQPANSLLRRSVVQPGTPRRTRSDTSQRLLNKGEQLVSHWSGSPPAAIHVSDPCKRPSHKRRCGRATKGAARGRNASGDEGDRNQPIFMPRPCGVAPSETAGTCLASGTLTDCDDRSCETTSNGEPRCALLTAPWRPPCSCSSSRHPLGTLTMGAADGPTPGSAAPRRT